MKKCGFLYKWLKINIIFLIVLAIIVFAIWFCSPSIETFVKPDTKLYKYSEIKDTLQTGDLVFLGGLTCGMRMICSLIRLPFSHVGMVIRVNNILYIWEADLGQRCKEGPRVMLLEDKLKHSKCKQIGALVRLNGKRDSFDNKMQKIIANHKDKTMDTLMYSWVLPSWAPMVKNDNKMFCSELMVQTYKELGILSDEKPSYKYGPHDLFFNRINLNKGYSLSLPEYFVVPYEKKY